MLFENRRGNVCFDPTDCGRRARAYAGDAFAGWQFLESTYPTLIHQIRLALNYFGATGAIEWGPK
jgi:hypothetical protein